MLVSNAGSKSTSFDLEGSTKKQTNFGACIREKLVTTCLRIRLEVRRFAQSPGYELKEFHSKSK